MKKFLAILLTVAMLSAMLAMMFAGVTVPASAAGNLGFAEYKAANPDTYYSATDFYINDAADLEAFAKDTQCLNADGTAATAYEEDHSYTGKTIHLMADIALTSGYTSIAGWAKDGSNNIVKFGFGGTFDGHGHTITGTTENLNGSGKGIFDIVGGDIRGKLSAWTAPTIKNLTLKNFHHSGKASDNMGGGLLIDCVYAGVSIENVHVVDSSMTVATGGWSATGIFMGALLYESTAGTFPVSYKNCSVRGVTSTGTTGDQGTTNNGRSSGMIIGYQWGTDTVLDLKIENCSFPKTGCDEYFGFSDKLEGIKINGTNVSSGDIAKGTSMDAVEAYFTDAVVGSTNRKITFEVEGQNDTIKIVANDATPDFGGTPSKPADAQNSYKFTGWSPALAAATADTTYTAQFAVATGAFDASDYANTQTFYIETVADLEAFSADTRVDGHSYAGKTVVLKNSITINDTTAADWYSGAKTITSISGNHGETKMWGFAGTFDGQGNTIKGLVAQRGLKSDSTKEGDFAGALFSLLRSDAQTTATVKNLIIDGFYSNNPNDECNQGVIVDRMANGANLENITIKNAILDVVRDASSNGSGFIAGTYYTDTNAPTAGGKLKMTGIKIDSSCKINYTAGNADHTSIGGLIGMVWSVGTPSNIEFNTSAINFEGIANYLPVGAVDPKPNEKAFTVNSTNCGNDLTKINDAFKASGCYGVAEPPAGHVHTPTEFSEIPATCQATGVAAGTWCSSCFEILSGGETLDIVACSTFENGVCTVCGKPDPNPPATTPEETTTEQPTEPEKPSDTTTAETPTEPEKPSDTTTGETPTEPEKPSDTTTGETPANPEKPSNTTTGEPTDTTTGEPDEAPAEDDCASCGGAGAIAAAALAVISIFGVAVIVKKN